ncbi:DUF4124 domain-containing protein [uncultured Legionella sp.]|uniref:DUF4124 domain-containing protein n=1 Tax=uncultured Legionella sp. TaxID=210934 RepID=UPI0026367D21|nr:DUF4124 domain-containing protein [uncultured Legionella sp.]
MKKLVLVVSCMFLFCVSYAQIFQWTDSQGVVHFSDQPHPGAKQLNIPDSQGYTPPASTAGGASSQEEQKTEHPSNDEPKYSKIAIIQPLNDATIRNNQGYIIVAVEMEPALAEGDALQMVFDGAPLGEPQSNTLFQLNGIYRGTHTMAVQILNSDGDILLTSESITIHMHRPRVGMVKGGNKGSN